MVGAGHEEPPLGSEPQVGGPQGVPPPALCTPGESAAAERREGQVTCASGYVGALPTSSAKPQSRKALSERYKGLYLIICFIISHLEPACFSFRSSRWSCAFPTALIERASRCRGCRHRCSLLATPASGFCFGDAPLLDEICPSTPWDGAVSAELGGPGGALSAFPSQLEKFPGAVRIPGAVAAQVGMCTL